MLPNVFVYDWLRNFNVKVIKIHEINSLRDLSEGTNPLAINYTWCCAYFFISSSLFNSVSCSFQF